MSGEKIIPLADWARKNKISSASVLNKAKRQTIPAFRKRGQWMIREKFVDTEGIRG